MAEPSNPHSTFAENPEPSSPVAAEEEEVEDNAPGKSLPVLKWSRSSFETFMRDIQMPPEYGATYPQEGDTAGDAPTGYVIMFSEFFGDCNLWLPFTNFVAEILEYYKLHISQLSPLGMIRVRNFKYTFRALGIEPIVGDFRRFCQLSVSLGFFSFRQREGTPKLMVPPKGMMKWKTKFFYVKAAAIASRLQFRNVTGTIITENISVPEQIRWIGFQIYGSLVGSSWRKEDAPLWRMFCLDFKGEIAIVACVDGEEGFNRTIRDNIRLPDRDALQAGVAARQRHRDLGALGYPVAVGVPKQHVQKMGDKRLRKKKMHEAVVVPPLVLEVAGVPRTRLRKYDDSVVLSDTLEGLGVPGGAAAAGGSSVGAKPVDDKKRK
ncbi:hypothetical protein Hdeb2414_s0264g00851881 [Helianthus debilis subsp. tardiflorus]